MSLQRTDIGYSADNHSGLPSEIYSQKLLNACSQLITTTQMITLRLEHEERIEEPEQQKNADLTLWPLNATEIQQNTVRAITGGGGALIP